MRISVLKGAALIAAAVAVAGLAVAGPADAAAKHPLGTVGMHPQVSGLRANAVHPDASTSFGAGYFSYPGETNGVASASTTFTMPSFSCHLTTDDEWLLPGIWDYDTSGTLTEQVDVNFNCNAGSLFMADQIVVGGANDNGTVAVSVGDRIEASLYYTSTATVGVIKDLTQHTSVTVTGAAETGDYTVFVGDEGPSMFGPTKVPTFGKLSFSSVQINGQYLQDWSPLKYSLNTSGNTQITTASLSSPQAFTTKFAHN